MKVQKNSTKAKKITVRFFLQTKVRRHTEIASGFNEQGKEIPAYPLYLYITYNRKNMQFRSNYGFFYTDMKDLEETHGGLIAFEEKLITKVIRYETSLISNEGEYDLKGLKDKYEIYATSIRNTLEKHLKPKLRLAILKTNNKLLTALNLDNSQSKNTVLRLYEVAGMIFNNFFQVLDKNLQEELEAYKKLNEVLPRSTEFNFPTVIDWLDGSYKKELNLLLAKVFKRKPELITSILKLIDRGVDEKIKAIEKVDQKYIEVNTKKK